jgi:hypothetical protein
MKTFVCSTAHLFSAVYPTAVEVFFSFLETDVLQEGVLRGLTAEEGAEHLRRVHRAAGSEYSVTVLRCRSAYTNQRKR